MPASEGIGALAPLLLRPEASERVVLEVRAQVGAAPDPATIQHLVETLRAVSGKLVSVDARQVPGAGQDWNARALTDLADQQSAHDQGGSQAVVRLLFLHGTYEGSRAVLGAAVRSDVAAMFSDQITNAAGLFTGRRAVETAVTTHEVGHLLGLVDLVVDAGRGDPDHPGHSRNPRSVMYWAVESDAISQLFGGPLPIAFDADDLAELSAIRSGPQ
ncbi:MAG: hypothetical protein Q8K58_11905 [Acidimicrobiales bacterium]|nr:hypothetical protein [Acidimicrobiales bacterium]